MAKSYRIFFYQINLNERFYSQHVVAGLEANGHTVYWNSNFKPLSLDQLLASCKRFQPDFVIMYGFTFINYLSSRGEELFTRLLNLPLCVIFTDNPLRYGFYMQDYRDVYYYCCDSELVALMHTEGYPNTDHLPLFFSPQHAYPRPKEARFSHPVAYAATYKALSEIKEFRQFWSRGMHQKIDEIFAIREQNPGHYVNYYLELKKRCGDNDLPGVNDYAFTVLCMQQIFEQKWQMRHEVLENVGVHELHVYGEHQATSELARVHHHPHLDQNNELPILYSSVKINLCTELHPVNVHQRIFEIAGCQGFCISEYKAEIETLFDYKTEAVCYESPEELPDLISYYLAHDNERDQIAKKSHERAMQCHTAEIRMREFIRLVERWL